MVPVTVYYHIWTNRSVYGSNQSQHFICKYYFFIGAYGLTNPPVTGPTPPDVLCKYLTPLEGLVNMDCKWLRICPYYDVYWLHGNLSLNTDEYEDNFSLVSSTLSAWATYWMGISDSLPIGMNFQRLLSDHVQLWWETCHVYHARFFQDANKS